MSLSYIEIIGRIGIAIAGINDRTDKLYDKIEDYSNKKKNVQKQDNFKRYHYEIENNNYKILKCRNEIKKGELFKKRCISYKDYLKSVEKKDDVNEKINKYKFIKNIQEETLFYYSSKEEELKQHSILEKICDKELNSLNELEKLEEEKRKKYDMLLKKNINIDEDKLYTLEYLNYDVLKVTNLLYKRKTNKKSSTK